MSPLSCSSSASPRYTAFVKRRRSAAWCSLPIKNAARTLAARTYGNERVLVLLETVGDAVRLFNGGNPFALLNIGNVHHAADRRRFTNAVYLGDAELEQLKGLMDRGTRVEIRSLPTESPIDLRQALIGGRPG